MGRRSLPKIPPGLDLSRHLLEVHQASWGIPESLFGRRAPWEIEVGSGKGLFLAQAAAAQPNHDFLGCEVAHKYAKFGAARLARANLPNAKILHGDALQWFHERLGDCSVRAVHVYFPDPWWKKRHHKRRVLNETFLTDVHRVLEVGGVLHFWTDVAEYYQRTCELIAARISLAGPKPIPEATAMHDLDYRTHFERRTRLAEEPVHRAQFVKEIG